jgi:hypothetical protein
MTHRYNVYSLIRHSDFAEKNVASIMNAVTCRRWLMIFSHAVSFSLNLKLSKLYNSYFLWTESDLLSFLAQVSIGYSARGLRRFV